MSEKKKKEHLPVKKSPGGWIHKREPAYGNPLPDHHTMMNGPFVLAGMRHVSKSKSSTLKPDTKDTPNIVSPPKYKRVANPYVVHTKKKRS